MQLDQWLSTLTAYSNYLGTQEKSPMSEPYPRPSESESLVGGSLEAAQTFLVLSSCSDLDAGEG